MATDTYKLGNITPFSPGILSCNNLVCRYRDVALSIGSILKMGKCPRCPTR